MPFTVIKQIIPLLPIDSLASLVRTSIRYAALANTSEFKKSMFIDGPPAPPPPHIRASLAAAQKLPDATNIDFIHPIFSRLYFMPTNPVQTVKLGSASSQLYLGTTKVKDCYATRPAVKELWFRIVGTKLPSGNRWDVRFRVGNEMGVTVWDLVRRLTAL